MVELLLKKIEDNLFVNGVWLDYIWNCIFELVVVVVVVKDVFFSFFDKKVSVLVIKF